MPVCTTNSAACRVAAHHRFARILGQVHLRHPHATLTRPGDLQQAHTPRQHPQSAHIVTSCRAECWGERQRTWRTETRARQGFSTLVWLFTFILAVSGKLSSHTTVFLSTGRRLEYCFSPPGACSLKNSVHWVGTLFSLCTVTTPLNVTLRVLLLPNNACILACHCVARSLRAHHARAHNVAAGPVETQAHAGSPRCNYGGHGARVRAVSCSFVTCQPGPRASLHRGMPMTRDNESGGVESQQSQKLRQRLHSREQVIIEHDPLPRQAIVQRPALVR